MNNTSATRKFLQLQHGFRSVLTRTLQLVHQSEPVALASVFVGSLRKA